MGKIKLSELLTESTVSGTFVSVDIQPEYEMFFGFSITEYVEFLNSNFPKLDKLIFLYNGYHTLGMIKEDDYINWLTEHGLNADVLDTAIFYDKGYAFFRGCMDEGVEEDDVVDFVKFMIKHDITDSRDLTRELWKTYAREQSHPWLREQLIALLEHTNEMIYIPDLMDFLKLQNNITLTGGAVNACLKEVEIALKALTKPYKIFTKFTY